MSASHPTWPGARASRWRRAVRALVGVVLSTLLVTDVVPAQAAALSPPGRATNVRGVVRDSLLARALPGALVQLVSDSAGGYGRTVRSDSSGLFEFTDVPDGRYLLGFHHDLLDSLGLEPIARPLVVDGQGALLVDLGTPSPARLRRMVCSAAGSTVDGGLVIGVVRDAARREPLADATVRAEWLEYTFGSSGVQQRRPLRTATTSSTGWFALCDVPAPGALLLSAARASDSTDVIEVQVPSTGVLRRELFVGPARRVASSDAETAPKRAGDGRLTGTVTSADGGRPLAGAVVGLVDGPETRTNASGAFALAQVPAGTRVLEVRAVAHTPVRQTVDVLADAPPVRVSLSTLQAVMDTVRARASARGGSDLVAFEQRRRTGQGRYLTREDIARRGALLTSDIFRAVQGVSLDGAPGASAVVTMRSITSDRCRPTFFVNGAMMNAMTADDLDLFVKPSDIVGIEVYMAGTAPPQFQDFASGAGGGGCGSIVIWSR